MAADLNDRTVWFETDALNITATDPGYTTGMLPTRVRNDGRAMMGALARDWDRRGPTKTTGGSANTQTLTYTVAPTAYVRGDTYSFVAGFTNTGAATLNVNGLGTIAIQRDAAALTGNEIIAGRTYMAALDTTSTCQLIGAGASRGSLIGVQTFTTAGTSTYTPTAGATNYVAEVLGGGGGGGGCALTGAAQIAVACGGAGGGYARKRGLISAISGATITVGAKGAKGAAGNNNGTAGGTSSIGAVVTASGGALGPGSGAVSVPQAQNGGSGGLGSSGDINIRGYQPTTVLNTSSALIIPQRGGGSFYSSGSEGGSTATGAAGNNGNGYGGGGGGACNAASQAAGLAGGDGTDGLVIIWEYS